MLDFLCHPYAMSGATIVSAGPAAGSGNSATQTSFCTRTTHGVHVKAITNAILLLDCAGGFSSPSPAYRSRYRHSEHTVSIQATKAPAMRWLQGSIARDHGFEE